MTLPFRNNPKIKTNWFNTKTEAIMPERNKKAYYDMSYDKGLLKIKLREEKKRRGTGKVESNWYGCLEFRVDSQFAKDIKMFLDEYIKDKITAKKRKK